MEDISLEQLEKWMNDMGLFVPSEDVNRLMSSEKIRKVLGTVIKNITTEEKVKHARRLLLLNQILTEPTNKCNNVSETSRRLEMIKKYVNLKSQLVKREEEFKAKKKKHSELVKNNEELIQEIQLTDCAIDEGRKKELFMLLNKKELQSMSKHWKSLREVVSDIKDVQKLKSMKENSQESKTNEVLEALGDCRSFIATVQNEHEDQIPSSPSSNLKHRMVQYVSNHLQQFSWEAIFGALIQLQKELNRKMETMNNISAGELELLKSKTSQESGFNEGCYKVMYEVFMKQLEFRSGDQIENLVPEIFPVESCAIPEELKSMTSRLNEIDHRIQEKIEEFQNMKEPVREKLEDVCKIRSRIKQFPVLLKKSIKKDDNRDFSLNKLHTCMQQLVSTATEEIKCFTEIPLVFLEKVQLLSGGSIEGCKLLFNHQKLHPYLKEHSKPSLTVLHGTSSLTTFDIVLHLFQQISYIGALNKTVCMLKPVSEPCNIVPFKMDIIVEGNERFQEMYNNFVSAVSHFECNIDDIATSLDIMKHHPLTSVVPKDYVVEGTTFEYWENKFTNCEND